MWIQKDNEWKMVFKIRYDHFKYQVMSFGLTNTPATFENYINKILMEKFNIFVIVYLDNIFIYFKSEGEEHVETVWLVLDQL